MVFLLGVSRLCPSKTRTVLALYRFLIVDLYASAAEDYFTAKAMGDVKALKDRNPEFALVLDDFDERKPPPLTSVPYKQLPVKDVAVGTYVLVKAGEVCSIKAHMLLKPVCREGSDLKKP
jgi:cation transport ATPase